jgi:hypothetical protein
MNASFFARLHFLGLRLLSMASVMRRRVQNVSRKSKQQFARTCECDGPLRDQIVPNPVVMANHADGIEVGTVAQGMAVGHHDHVVMVFDRGSDGGIDAEIRCPSGNQQPIRHDFFQPRRQVRPRERIVQILLDDDIGRISKQFGKKRPARRLRFEIVALAAAMLHEDHRAGLLTHLGGEPVDAFDDAAQIVFGIPVEQSNLHVDDEHGVHRASPSC